MRADKVFTQEEEIADALRRLSTEVEEVVQQRLSNTYADVEAYNAPIVLDANPSATLVDQVLGVAASRAESLPPQGIPFQKIAVRRANWWTGSAADGVSLAIGLEGGGAVYQLELGTHLIQHALI